MSVATAASSPSCNRCVMSTVVVVSLSLTTFMPPATDRSGPMSNGTSSSGTMSAIGTSADDVTAETENTACYTNTGIFVHEVLEEVVIETGIMATVTSSLTAVAPVLASPTGGTVG